MYQALYRMWRPQTFDQVIGQDTIVQTLKNAIVAGKVSHAYLLTGPRGTGKTSVAKIFAKALNCPNEKDGNPCGECDICQGIAKGAISDVIEIDAASNNGVDEMRDIRDKSRYAPTQVAYKVYIIDEVHMLSSGAFNALLKTLEEPTDNVIFILATTEPHKIPATILSRTQRFDFQKMTRAAIENHLATILEHNHIAYDDDVLSMLSRLANGGMRDALSLLDQVISYSGEHVRVDDVVQIAGAIKQDVLLTYLNHLQEQDGNQAIRLLHQLFDTGVEPSRFIEELLYVARDLLLVHQVSDSTLLDNLVSDVSSLQQVPVDPIFLYQLTDRLARVQDTMKLTTQKEIYLEVFTLESASQIADEVNDTLKQEVVSTAVSHAESNELEQLKQQIQALQNEVHTLKQNVPSVNETDTKKHRKKATRKEYQPNYKRIFSILNIATSRDRDDVVAHWSDILSGIDSGLASYLANADIFAASPQGILVGVDNDFMCDLIDSKVELHTQINKMVQKIVGHPGNVVSVPKGNWPTIRQKFIRERSDGLLAQYNLTDQTPSLQTRDVLNYIDEQVKEDAVVDSEEQQFVKRAQELFGQSVTIQEEENE